MTYPTNDFDSATSTNISVSSSAPTVIFDSSLIPQGGYAMILGIIASNKSSSGRGLNLTLRKSGAAQAAHILFNVALPAQTAFQIIDGDKFVVKRGDVLSAWADTAGANAVDLVISYVIYTPAS
jgi:hypothetical protein